MNQKPTLLTGGRLLRGDEVKKYAKRRGLCQNCARFRTHKKVGCFLFKRMVPVTTETDGEVTVYKGYCIQPTCYQSVREVQELLGEIPRSQPLTPKTFGGSTATSSNNSQLPPEEPQPLAAPPPPEPTPSSPEGNQAPINSRLSSDSGDSEPTSMVLQSLSHSPTANGTGGLQRLESLAEDGDFVEFFVRLEADGSTPDVVLHAFQILREQIAIHQAARPDGMVICGNGWVKTIGDKTLEFKKSRSVVLEGLMALLTICQQPYNYKKTIIRAGGVGLVISLMAEYDGDDDVEEHSCSIIDCLSKTPKDKLNANHNKVGAVIQKMVDVVVQSSNIKAKMAALSALCNLSKQKSNTTTSLLHAIDQTVIPIGGDFADACAAVLLDAEMSEELAGSIASLLCVLSLGHERGRDGDLCLATEFLSDALAATAQRFNSPSVVEAAFEMREMIDANVLHKQEAQTASAYTEILCEQPELFTTLMDDAGSDPSAALSLVRGLRESGALECNVLGRKVFEVLISTMSDFRDSEGVQSEACLLLSEAVQRGSEACLAVCSQGSGISIIADALCRHRNNDKIAESGCYAMLLALRQSSFRQLSDRTIRTYVTEALVSTMSGGGGEKATMESIGAFLECIKHDAQYFSEMGNNPAAIRAVAASMNKYLKSEEFQRAGCSFLRALSQDPHSQQSNELSAGCIRRLETIGREGGITAVMKSMGQHKQSTEVCAATLSIISRLSMVTANKLILTQNGGISTILQNVEPQMRNPHVVSSLFMALHNIVVEPERNSVADVDDEVILLLDNSMRQFPKNKRVQTKACLLLSSCAYRSSNLRMMRRYRHSLVPSLAKAADEFPESCGKPAKSVTKYLLQDR